MKELDNVDLLILSVLNDHARMSIKALSQQIGLSAPSTTERVNRLEEQGVITGYQAKINPESLGYPLEAIVRVKPMAGALHRVERMIQAMPECVECDKVTGEDCYVMRLQLRSIQHLDEALDPLTLYAQSNSALVKSTPVKRRTVQPWS